MTHTWSVALKDPDQKMVWLYFLFLLVLVDCHDLEAIKNTNILHVYDICSEISAFEILDSRDIVALRLCDSTLRYFPESKRCFEPMMKYLKKNEYFHDLDPDEIRRIERALKRLAFRFPFYTLNSIMHYFSREDLVFYSKIASQGDRRWIPFHELSKVFYENRRFKSTHILPRAIHILREEENVAIKLATVRLIYRTCFLVNDPKEVEKEIYKCLKYVIANNNLSLREADIICLVGFSCFDNKHYSYIYHNWPKTLREAYRGRLPEIYRIGFIPIRRLYSPLSIILDLLGIYMIGNWSQNILSYMYVSAINKNVGGVIQISKNASTILFGFNNLRIREMHKGCTYCKRKGIQQPRSVQRDLFFFQLNTTRHIVSQINEFTSKEVPGISIMHSTIV
ncbi:hypothetical protein ROZALSC1DRAFT_23542 [Rozella allomycis CSF55]|uniref:Uncharacterized protein n=1 Tax=Rozella allomycis (strain CSF55) TaxID=988480 RepID=A0A4P9YFR5_ROZAC|nr:hypothetical protein ROZALSC1DRAFT_23542 [Rozella allomycis CSF55]